MIQRVRKGAEGRGEMRMGARGTRKRRGRRQSRRVSRKAHLEVGLVELGRDPDLPVGERVGQVLPGQPNISQPTERPGKQAGWRKKIRAQRDGGGRE
eukprot:2013427-Rhodomonas_salina.1